jgi:hypothetical protein
MVNFTYLPSNHNCMRVCARVCVYVCKLCDGIVIQGDQKVSVHLMITVQENMEKYFKQFQSLTMIT